MTTVSCEYELSPRFGGLNARPIKLADGWKARPLLPTSKLVGVNGICMGPDGRVYAAEAMGSEISAIDIGTGEVSLIARADLGVHGPDDVAFDSDGNLYVTELFKGRVGVVTASGEYRTVAMGLPNANGIATLGKRVFVNEYREGGGIFEIAPDTGEKRPILLDRSWPNGMSVTEGEVLYYPAVHDGEIWRVNLDGSANERIAHGLTVPTAVKHGPDGLVYTVERRGRVLSIDPDTGAIREIVTVPPGLDNLVFAPSGHLLVSNSVRGSITEIDLRAATTREVLKSDGLIGPFGVTINAAGTVVVADTMSYLAVDDNGSVTRPVTDTTDGFVGYFRGALSTSKGRLLFSTVSGAIVDFTPGAEPRTLTSELSEPLGMAENSWGEIAIAEAGAGQLRVISPDGRVTVLADSLDRPTSVASSPDGTWIVSEASASQVTRIESDGKRSTVMANLEEPHGVSVVDEWIYVVERGARRLTRCLQTGEEPEVVAEDLPVDNAAAIEVPLIEGLPPIAPGPWPPFNDLAITHNGTLLVSSDQLGTVLAITHGTDAKEIQS